jgi:hypothetical protein
MMQQADAPILVTCMWATHSRGDKARAGAAGPRRSSSGISNNRHGGAAPTGWES